MRKVLDSALLIGGALGISQAAEAVNTPGPQLPAPAGQKAPNVVWILIDDVGFGAISSYGGLIETPNLDALAAQGLRYTNFHTTAISSPTRSALLTGRNHHNVSMGLFPETAIDHPGYNAHIPANKGTVAEYLRENGFSTFAVGKWHLTPVNEATPAGPFNRWPTGKGFEHYYGFLYGETDQWHPQLIEETNRVAADPQGRHLNELLTDKAIKYVGTQKSVHPDQPFFLYFAPGATHAPHQVSQKWIDQYKGKFDKGWDYYRETVFANQKKLGIIPADTTLPARNPYIKAWDSLSDDQKKLYARYFETYAGFLSYTDAEIGRLVEYLKSIDQFDNTIIAVVVGDNGASKEGTEHGTSNGLAGRATPESFEADIKNIDKIGTEYTSPNYPLGWAQAANAPFKYWKQDANSEGGTRNPLILSYPRGIADKGGIRTQYGHVIDLLPTTLELAHLEQPKTVAGVKQDNIQGTSLAYSIADAKAASQHKVQYYEINGTRAIYKDGWKAATLHRPGTPFDKDVWELYNLNQDPTEVTNLAEKEPAKLKELRALFDSEGKKNNVFPLKDTLFKDFIDYNGAFANRKEVVLYPQIDQIFGLSAPNLSDKAYSLTAHAEIAATGSEGVLFADGGRFGGVSLYLQNGKLNFAYNNGEKSLIISSNNAVPAGKHKLRVDVSINDAVDDKHAGVTLYVDDLKVAEGQYPYFESGLIAQKHLAFLAYDEGFDVGRDLQSPVTENYQGPYPFTGKLEKIVINYNQ